MCWMKTNITFCICVYFCHPICVNVTNRWTNVCLFPIYWTTQPKSVTTDGIFNKKDYIPNNEICQTCSFSSFWLETKNDSGPRNWQIWTAFKKIFIQYFKRVSKLLTTMSMQGLKRLSHHDRSCPHALIIWMSKRGICVAKQLLWCITWMAINLGSCHVMLHFCSI